MSQAGPPGVMHVTRRDPDRRRALLDAADRVVEQFGTATTLSAVVAEAGVTKPVLYRHFGDKAGLYRALVERHTERLLETLRAAMRTPGLRPATEATVDAYLRLIESQPQLYRFLTERPVDAPQMSGDVSLFVRGLGDALDRAVAGALGHPVPASWGHAVVGLVRGAGEWWLDEPAEMRLPRSALVRDLCELMFSGLGAAPRPSATLPRSVS